MEGRVIKRKRVPDDSQEISEFGKRYKSNNIITALHVESDDSQDSNTDSDMSDKYCSDLIINDPIHGHIELHPVLVAIIDTPQFQRLRYIKQLGFAYLVYPSATHSRFEHSIGVSHLAKQLLVSISQKQPYLGITDKDILCCAIAGLCHDLGHGCFSHFYQYFLPVTSEKSWRHEDMSTDMLDYLIQVNNLMPLLNEYGFDENDVAFVKEMISNKPLGDTRQDWAYIGRGKDKSFLYDIVANKISGLDVDKWDYIQRDAHHLGIPNNFDSNRLMKFLRVIEVEGRKQICIRDKELNTVYEMFATRAKLFRSAYFHKTVQAIDHMFTDVLKIADPYIKYPTAVKGEFVTLSEASRDFHAYSYVNDSVIHTIRTAAEPKLDGAKELLNKIMERKLYPLLGRVCMKDKIEMSKEELAAKICSFQTEIGNETETPLSADDLKIDLAMVHFGMKQNNPLTNLYFFSKTDINKAFKISKTDLSSMLPTNFGEYIFSVYCQKMDKDSIEIGKKCFHLFKENGNFKNGKDE